MKEEISALELFYLTKELQTIIGGRLDKIYQQDRSFLITMHVPSKGKFMLKIMPNTIYLTNYKGDFPPIGGFTMFLRKHLSNSRIRRIEQKYFERIIEIEFETKEKTTIMIVELFSNGNVILCDKDHKIMSALESNKWKDRIIRGGIIYEEPPKQVNTPKLSEKEFLDIISSSEKESIVKTLATDLSLGGLYAEELCLLSKMDKTKQKITVKEGKILYTYLQKIISKKINSEIIGKEIVPFHLETLGKGECFKSFNEAIDETLSEKNIKAFSDNVEKKKNTALDKIKKIIFQQEETIKGLKLSEEENQKKGEFIYEHYKELEKILEGINIARKKMTWEEIKEKIDKKIITKINDKQGTLTINLDK